MKLRMIVSSAMNDDFAPNILNCSIVRSSMPDVKLHPNLAAEIRERSSRLNRLTGILILAGGMGGLVPITLWWYGILKL